MKKIVLSLLSLCLFATVYAQKVTTNYPEFKVEVSGTGPDLILIPGATCSGEVWKETVLRYQQDFTCHVFTLAGYAGVPALNEAPMLPKIKSGLLRYISEKTEQPIIMGHSIGGFLALQIAAETHAISKVIVVDALPFLAGINNSAMTEEIMRKMPVEPMVAQYTGMDEESF